MPTDFQSRYGQVADSFDAYRPPYPAEVFDRILAAVPSDRRRRAIDLGAGTGKATRVLAQYFSEIVAVEADPLMAEKLRIAVSQATVEVTTAENSEQLPALADLVNIATALRWMDAPRVMTKVVNWLRPGGIFASYGYFPPGTPEPLASLVRAEFENHWDNFVDARIRDITYEQETIRDTSGLWVIDDREVANVVPYTPRQFAGFCRSTSYGSAYGRTLSDPEEYWRGLESRFREAWGEDKIPVDFNLWFILARRDS